MNKNYLLIGVLFVLLSVSLVDAQSIEVIKLNVSSSGLVQVTKDFKVIPGASEFSVLLPKHTNLDVSSSGVPLPYNTRSVSAGVWVDIDLNGRSNSDSNTLSVNYETQYLTSKNGSVWTLSYLTETTPRNTIVKLFLPTNSTIVSFAPREILFSLASDSMWFYPQDMTFNFTCIYEHTGSGLIIPGDDGDDNLLMNILLLLVIFSVLVVAYVVFKKRSFSSVVSSLRLDSNNVVSDVSNDEVKKTGLRDIQFEFKTDKNKPRLKPAVFNVLDPDERTIVSFISEHGPDDVTQAFIYKTTRMPKSSLSEIIKRLEKRNVVESTKKGRVKWISIKKWVLE